jgi:hypothetical protein
MRAKNDVFKNKMVRVGLVAALSVAFTLPLGLFLPLASTAAISQDANLAKLEVKFFKHTYTKDDDQTRLERLEKMIFGETRTGEDGERLKNLCATVPNLDDLPAEAADKTAGNSGGSTSADKGQETASSSAPPSSESAKPSRRGKHGKSDGGSAGSAPAPVAATPKFDGDDEASGKADKVLAGESKYPSVTALEQHLFKRDYASEPVGDRLNRLETKVFGRPSKFTDLSERVDALKEKTNVDIASKPPTGSDWNTDDDDGSGHTFPTPKKSEPVARTDRDDGRSFSGRDVGSDLRKAFGVGATGNTTAFTGGRGSGAFGMGGTSGRSSGNAASGAYGMGGSRSAPSSNNDDGDDRQSSSGKPTMSGTNGKSFYDDDSDADSLAARVPKTKNPVADRAASKKNGGGATVPAPAAQEEEPEELPPGMNNPNNLSMYVGKLETSVLGKQYSQEPLIDRVGRLEKSVFPKEPESTMAVPQRVNRLLKKVPNATQTASRSGRGRANGSGYANGGAGGGSTDGGGGGSQTASARHKHSGWIDEDADLGYAKGGGGATTGDDSYSSGNGSSPDVIGIGAGSGSSMSSMMGGGMGGSSSSMGGMSGGQVQQPKGLSKIINKMGNALSGNSFSGGYNVNSSNLRTDPKTGMLVDTMTGNVINPNTGAVVGQATTTTTTMGSGAPIYSGIGGLGGLGGLGGIGGIGGLGGMGMGMGMPMGGYGYNGGLPNGYAYGGMPYGSLYGGNPYGGVRPYGYGTGMGMGGYPGFNNGFGSYNGMGNYNGGMRSPMGRIGF